MAINLQKHRAELEKAWENVHNPEHNEDWVIFGYDGKTYELKVVEKGDGGLEEMVDSLSGGKILYAAVRVMDPNTNLPKLVFINWQGEGVPSSVKGTCASHWRDVTNLFKGAHVTIQARSEDDLEEDIVMDKVKKSSGANYSFHKEKPKRITNPSGQVGTNYKRVNPLAEINVKSRDKFWMEQEKAEQQRREEEKQRLADLRRTEDEQRRKREAKEQLDRDKLVKERALSVESQRAAAKRETERRKEEEKRRYEETIREANRDDAEFRKRSESLRKQRLMEAQELIRERKKSLGEISPRDTFEVGQKKVPPPVQPKKKSGQWQRPGIPESPETTEKKAPPATQPKPRRGPPPVANEQAPRRVREPSPEPVKQPAPVRQPSPEPVREPSPEPVPVREPSPEPVREPSPEPVREPSPEPQPELKAPEEPQDLYEEVPDISSNQPVQVETYDQIADPTQQAQEDSRVEQEDLYETIEDTLKETKALAQSVQTSAEVTPAGSGGLTVRAVYDYQAADETEITFDPGEIITDVEQIDEGWWRGTAPNGHYGLFPANYVEVVSEAAAPVAVADPEPPQTTESTAPEPREEQPSSTAPPALEGLTARAVYDYQAADDTEISFDPNDIITQIEQIDADWWTGTTKTGQHGMFPANYVELISDNQSASQPAEPQEADSGLRAKALFDYQAVDNTEISFDPGDIITNIEQVDPGWWKGTGPSGLNGLFPANYVELIA